MDHSNPPHVLVVGAGLSGLATAFYLSRMIPNIRLTVAESTDRIGGVIQTETIDGFLVEHGADMFSSEPSEALQLCRDMGIEKELIEPQEGGRGAMIVRGGRLRPIPEGFVLMRATRLMPMLTTPLISLRGKLRLLREPFIAARACDDDESVAAFTRRRLGAEMLERVIQPLVGGIYTADPERLSMAATMPAFVAMERQHGSLAAATRARRRGGVDSRERNSSGARYSQFRGFPDGMSHWLHGLAARLPDGALRTTVSIESLRPLERRWRIGTSGNIEIADADAVVLATPARVAARLTQPFAPDAAGGLLELSTASSVVLAVGVRNEDLARCPNTFGFVVPISEGRSILACSFASHKFPGRAPQGHTLLRVFMGGALQPELCQRDDGELRALAAQDLKTLIGWNGKSVFSRVLRWNNAMPQYHVGHLQRVAQIEASLADFPNLAIAGNSLHGVGIAPVVRTARLRAQQIATSLGFVNRERDVP